MKWFEDGVGNYITIMLPLVNIDYLASGKICQKHANNSFAMLSEKKNQIYF